MFAAAAGDGVAAGGTATGSDDGEKRQRGSDKGYDESRYTIGLNYWLGPSTVLKTAYQFDDRSHGSQNQNAILIQAAMGF